MFKTIFILASLISVAAIASPTTTLKAVEKKYQEAAGIQMNVVKKIRIELLDREKKSEGAIKIKTGGLFKWEVERPERSMILLTPNAVWVVDYPIDDQDKLSVLKTKKPKKNQSPAVVAFLVGQGSLLKNFKIMGTKKIGDDVDMFQLLARKKEEAVQKLNLFLNHKEMQIDKISFLDSLGNQTTLEFKNINFLAVFDDSEFKFTPPKNADVSIID